MDIDVKGVLREARKDSFNQDGPLDLEGTPPTVPKALLNFPTVCIFLNTIINALNELRHIALMSIRRRIGTRLLETMKGMVEIVKEAKPKDDTGGNSKKLNARYSVFVEHGVQLCIKHLTTLFLFVYGNTHKEYIDEVQRESSKLVDLAMGSCERKGDAKGHADRPKRASQLEESDDDENDAIL